LAQTPHHKWCFAGRADRDLEGSAPDPGRQVEGAQLGIISDIAPDAGPLRFVEDRSIGLPVVSCRKNQRPTVAGITIVGTLLEIDFPTLGHFGQWFHNLGRYNRNPRPLLDQTLHLAQGNTATPHDQNTTVFYFQ